MKKTLLSAMAAGALAFGGAASAQDLGRVLGDILSNIGNQSQYYGHGSSPPPGSPDAGEGRVFSEGGRWIYEDQFGRRSVIPGEVVFGPQGPMYRDAWGNWVHVASGSAYDRDGDGVADTSDRYPTDRRYW